MNLKTFVVTNMSKCHIVSTSTQTLGRVDNKMVELRSAATKVSAGERRRDINKEYCSLYTWMILCHEAVPKT
jgi:hypothetical protein